MRGCLERALDGLTVAAAAAAAAVAVAGFWLDARQAKLSGEIAALEAENAALDRELRGQAEAWTNAQTNVCGKAETWKKKGNGQPTSRGR